MKFRASIQLISHVLLLLVTTLVVALLTLLAGCGGTGTQQSALQPPPPPPPALVIMTAALPNGIIGMAYNQPIQVSGGVAPFSWTLTGTLPHNLSLSSSTTSQVTLTGTPDTAGQNAAFSIQVKDSAKQVATQAYDISILLQATAVALSPANLDLGTQVLGSASKLLAATLTNNANSEIMIPDAMVPFRGAQENQHRKVRNAWQGSSSMHSIKPDLKCLVVSFRVADHPRTLPDNRAVAPPVRRDLIRRRQSSARRNSAP